MNISKQEYNELVEKLASEIIDSVAEEMEKEASFKGKAMSMGRRVKGIYTGKANRSAKERYGELLKDQAKAKKLDGQTTPKMDQMVAGAKKRLNKERAIRAGAYAGTAATIGGGAYLAKKKAAEMIEENQMLKIAAAEVLEEAETNDIAILDSLAEMGIDPEEFIQELVYEAEGPEDEEFEGEYEDGEYEDEEYEEDFE